MTIHINGKPYEAQAGKKLVKEIERLGIDISHRCGGRAMCTTCRVNFQEGEPVEMSVAEKGRLQEADLLGHVRLSCQMKVVDGMDLVVLMPVSDAEWDDAGTDLIDEIEPEFILS